MSAFTKDGLFAILCLHAFQKCSLVWNPKSFLAWYSSPFHFPFQGGLPFLFLNQLLPKWSTHAPHPSTLTFFGLFSYIISLNHKCSLCFPAFSEILSLEISSVPLRTFSLPLSNSLSSCFLYHSFSIHQTPSSVDVCVFSNDCVLPPQMNYKHHVLFIAASCLGPCTEFALNKCLFLLLMMKNKCFGNSEASDLPNPPTIYVIVPSNIGKQCLFHQ